MYLDHVAVATRRDNVLISIHFSRIYSTEKAKKTKLFFFDFNEQVKSSLTHHVNWVFIFIENNFAAIVWFWWAFICANDWCYLIVTILKLQNYFFVLEIKCSLQYVLMMRYCCISSKFFHYFLREQIIN